jgi:F0F1-type ATP synthase assembly protein I
VVSTIICIVGGLLLDRQLGTSPWLTLAGVGLGLAAAAYQLYELSTVGRRDRAPAPIARAISQIPLGRSAKAAPDESEDEQD